MLKNSATHYGVVARGLHWLMALLILTLIGVGWYMAGLPDDAPNRGNFYMLHKSFGVVVMLLLMLRLVWLFVSPPPPAPAALKKIEVLLSKTVTGMLYILMLAVPFSGYAMSTFAGYKVSVFGLCDMPVLFAKNPDMATLAASAHQILSYVMLALIIVHLIGALKHRMYGPPEADVLKRML
jgi:cytochrome b561